MLRIGQFGESTKIYTVNLNKKQKWKVYTQKLLQLPKAAFSSLFA